MCTIMLAHKVPLDTFDSPFEGCYLQERFQEKGLDSFSHSFWMVTEATWLLYTFTSDLMFAPYFPHLQSRDQGI